MTNRFLTDAEKAKLREALGSRVVPMATIHALLDEIGALQADLHEWEEASQYSSFPIKAQGMREAAAGLLADFWLVCNEYATHKPSCAVFTRTSLDRRQGKYRDCTCGLDEARRRWAGEKK